MNKLLIIGAGTYACVAYEIAIDMGEFERIDFLDDNQQFTPNGISVRGKLSELEAVLSEYDAVVVAIGNPDIRLSYLQKINDISSDKIGTLVSPKAYISASAVLAGGCIIEPMAVVHALCRVGQGCFVCAGAVLNHASVCEDGVQVDCNATVEGYATVPSGFKVEAGQVFKKTQE